MNNLPLVSVVIPTFKRSDYLLRTIDSIVRQTYKNIEIIVVDDNGIGTDFQIATQNRIFEKYDSSLLKYICHEVNKNGSAARNTGFKMSKGEYVNFLDDDDILMPEKIEKQVLRLLSSPVEVGATYCNSIIHQLDGLGNPIDIEVSSDLKGDVLKEYMMGKCRFNTSALLFKRDCISQLNGFDESYRRHQDMELMVRFFDKFKIIPTADEPLMVYDVVGGRTVNLNSQTDFQLKRKFMADFSDIFIRKGILNDVGKTMWWDCLNRCLKNNDIDYFKKSLREYRKYGSMPLKYKLVLLRSFVKRLMKKK